MNLNIVPFYSLSILYLQLYYLSHFLSLMYNIYSVNGPVV